MRFEKRSKAKFSIGKATLFGERVVFGPACKDIKIGFGCYIGDDVYIDVPELIIGDYVKIHKRTTIHGYKPCHIGHNCWIGAHSLIDSVGGVTIGNNVGMAGQFWSHIKFGDALAGCRWNNNRPLVIKDDVWFVGWCLVSPITAEARSMALAGSVITKDMKENHTYAGVPAKDITAKVGRQFKPLKMSEMEETMIRHLMTFLRENKLKGRDFDIEFVADLSRVKSSEMETYFNLKDRTYLPSRSKHEVAFMKYLLYDKAKFVPCEEK